MFVRAVASSGFWPVAWAAFFIIMLVLGVAKAEGLVVAFGVMGLAAGAISLLWNKLSLEELYYERDLPQRMVFVGEEIPMTVVVSNRKPIPLTWMRIEDDLPDTLQVIEGDMPSSFKTDLQTLRHSASIKWYERLRWRYRLRCTERGLYMLGPAFLESGDPFGFRRSQKTVAVQDSLLVYPRIIPLEDLGLPAGRPLGDVSGGLRIFPDPSRPAGLREYQKGDPLKTVDWKATAKAQELQVRTFEPSTSVTVILVVAVDTREPYWESYAPENLERVLTVAASVASHAAERHYTLGLFTNDMPIPVNRPMAVPPGRGREQLSVVLGALATVRKYAFGPMSSRLGEHVRGFPLGATIAVATAFIPPDFASVLSELKSRGHKIVVLYLGEEPCPKLEEGIVVHELRDSLIELEEAGVLLAA